MSRIFISFILFICIFQSCSDNPTNSVDIPPTPEQLEDGWQVSSLSSEGMNPEWISWLSSSIQNGDAETIRSVVIVRNGKLVFEEYYQGYTRTRLHTLASVTKSVLSLLIGIAVDQGYIDDINDPIESYLPQYTSVFSDDSLKREISVKDLLTMSSGLEWDEWTYAYGNSWNSHFQMEQSADWIQFVLERPLIEVPGSSFTYNSGNSILLGGILNQACGTPADTWAEQVLFEPLDISTYSWSPGNLGLPHTGGGLHLRPRDLAKIGLLVLNKGKWGEDQIVSEDWLFESTRSSINVWPGVNYGYHWWLRPLPQTPGILILEDGVIHGWGYAGQFLFIVPEFDLVVVFTSWNIGEYETVPIALLYQFIFASLQNY